MEKKRLQRTADNLESIRKILTNAVWIAIILIILGAVGWYVVKNNIVAGGKTTIFTPEHPVEKQVPPPIDWEQVDGAVADALLSSRQSAREYAEKEIDLWINGLMARVDTSFLDWYFSYWTQQSLGLKGLWQYGVHYVLAEQPTATEKITEEIQAEFAGRVLQPEVAEKVLERIVSGTAGHYVAKLQPQLGQIPDKYAIGKAEWNSYLEDIAITAQATEGGRQMPLTLKAITVSGAGGAVLLSAQMKMLLGKVSGKVLAKSSGKAASAMAAKTGGKVAAKVGGKFLGTIAGFGVLIWDVWDHHVTEKENRPLLRQSLQDYFNELKAILLDDAEVGIMATFSGFERKVAAQQESQVLQYTPPAD